MPPISGKEKGSHFHAWLSFLGGGPIFLEVLLFMRKVTVLLIAVVLAVFCMGTMAMAEEPLLVYCGAGLMKPMDELQVAFQEKENCQVRMVYAGSGELFGMIATRKNGDVYIPGAEKYTRDALKKGLVVEKGCETICYHVPVILTPKGNPGHITSLEDLAKDGVRLAMADAQAAAIGKVSKQVLEKNNLYDRVKENIVTSPSTTNQLLIYTATAQVDGTIAWEDQSTWAQSKGKVEIIHIDASKNIIKTIPASVVSFSQRPEMAEKFIQFITSDEGKAIWNKWGFPLEKPL
jgi:molybdate transport system substrate-binding protein